MDGSFIEKSATIGLNIGNFMSYLHCKLGTIGKKINPVAGSADS
jgi:hypothetical protein